MPIYEYQCRKCGQRIEVVQSFSDKPLRRHEECGGELQKVFHPAGIIFKGSGFYSTDSRSSSKPKEAAKKDDPGTKKDSED